VYRHYFESAAKRCMGLIFERACRAFEYCKSASRLFKFLRYYIMLLVVST
jgi:hypothetical protein